MKFCKEQVLQRRKDMALLTQQGNSIPIIAKMYGISRQAVSQILQKAARDGHKVVLRKRKGAIDKANYEYRPTKKELGINKICESCGKEFNTKSKIRKTCGKDCKRSFARERLIASKGSLGRWSRYENVELVCDNCGKTFERSKYRDSISRIGCGTKHTYCTRDCFHEKCKKDGASRIVKVYKGSKWPVLQDKET